MNIKIFVSCHKQCDVFRNKYIFPIQVGSAIAQERFDNMLHDDEGDNISSLNPMYCELTAQYWAWKNVDADYYGFMHYRRYFSLSSALLPEDCYGNIVLDNINQKNIAMLGLDETNIENTLQKYDIITLIPNDISKLGSDTVYNHARDNSPYHKIEDLDEILQIISKKHPQYLSAAKEYLSSSKGYFCNMYILKKDIFNTYCEWLFDILETHRKSKSFEEYSVDELRVSGFWAERLWGIFFTYLKSTNSNLKYREVQKSFFKDTNNSHIISPAFKTKNIPVVFAADNNYVPILGVALKSIVLNTTQNNNYDIIVLHQNISSYNQQRLESEIVQLQKNISLRFINVEDIFAKKDLVTPAHFTIEIYFRLIIQDIMKSYDKVIYLDSDLIVNTDIAELYNVPIGNNYVAAVQDVDSAGCYKAFDPNRKDYFNKVLKLKNPYAYFNSGVLVMNLSAFRENYTSAYILNLAENTDYIFPDQDVLNILCEGKVLYLNESWNTLTNHKDDKVSRLAVARLAPYQIYNNYLKARKDPLIIHYAGYQKPWEYSDCDMGAYFWRIARKTIFLEELTEKLIFAKANRESLLKNVQIPEQSSEQPSTIKYIDGIDDPIYLDGLMVKFIKKVNKKLPIGSSRREIVKKIFRPFIK